MRKQTWFDVRHTDGEFKGLGLNSTPLLRPDADRLAEQYRNRGYEIEVIPTADELWERTFGEKYGRG